MGDGLEGVEAARVAEDAHALRRVCEALRAHGLPEWQWDDTIRDYADGEPESAAVDHSMRQFLLGECPAALRALHRLPRCRAVRVHVDWSHPVQYGKVVLEGVGLADALARCRPDWAGREAVLEYTRAVEDRLRRRKAAVDAFLAQWSARDKVSRRVDDPGCLIADDRARAVAEAAAGETWDMRCPEPPRPRLEELPPVEVFFTEAVPRPFRAMFDPESSAHLLVCLGTAWAHAHPVVPDDGDDSGMQAAQDYRAKMWALMDAAHASAEDDRRSDEREERRQAKLWNGRMWAFMDGRPPDPSDHSHPDARHRARR